MTKRLRLRGSVLHCHFLEAETEILVCSKSRLLRQLSGGANSFNLISFRFSAVVFVVPFPQEWDTDSPTNIWDCIQNQDVKQLGSNKPFFFFSIFKPQGVCLHCLCVDSMRVSARCLKTSYHLCTKAASEGMLMVVYFLGLSCFPLPPMEYAVCLAVLFLSVRKLVLGGVTLKACLQLPRGGNVM